MSIIIFLISLALLILVHEFGHFIVAKISGIRVDEFGLGFPPKLLSKKYGQTLYTINAIPFGGFVKIYGENSHTVEISEIDKPRSFLYKPKWIQALVLVAGVSMNIIFAWFLISVGFMIGLPTPVDHSGFGTAQDLQVVVVEVMPESPAEKAGLKIGDTVSSVSDGKKIIQNQDLTPENISALINESQETVDISYRRGKEIAETISLEADANIVSGRKVIGITMENIGILKLPIHLAVLEGARTTWLLTKATVVGLGSFFRDIVVLKSDFSQVAGPVGIAGVVSEAKDLGFVYLISLVALISINLAIINLLPFPALDGGRLLFVAIEAIIRRPISPKVVQWSNVAGFAFLIILMIIVTINDVSKLL